MVMPLQGGTLAALHGAVATLREILMPFLSPGPDRDRDGSREPTVAQLAPDLTLIEFGRLREAGAGEVRRRLALVRERNGLPRHAAVEPRGRSHLFAVAGTGLGQAGQRELLANAYYLEMPDTHWDLGSDERLAKVRAILGDPDEALGHGPAEGMPARPRPGADRSEYFKLPFEVEPELVERWAGQMGLPDPGDGKAG